MQELMMISLYKGALVDKLKVLIFYEQMSVNSK